MSLRTPNFDRHVVMVDSAVPKPHAAGHTYVLDAVWLTLTQATVTEILRSRPVYIVTEKEFDHYSPKFQITFRAVCPR